MHADSEYISYRDNQAFFDEPITQKVIAGEVPSSISAPAASTSQLNTPEEEKTEEEGKISS